MRVLSGIQPTGPIHWGNYFGAIRQYIALQDNEQAFYFIANLHALTTVREAAKLRQWTFDIAVDLLALGLDPEKATLFVQSDVPEVTELSTSFVVPTALSASLFAPIALSVILAELTAPSAIFAFVTAPLAKYVVVIAPGATPSGLAEVPSPVSDASVVTL